MQKSTLIFIQLLLTLVLSAPQALAFNIEYSDLENSSSEEGSLVASSFHTVSGIVRSNNNEALVQAEIIISSGGTEQRAFTGPNGDFLLSNVPSGAYTATVVKSGQELLIESGNISGDSVMNFTMTARTFQVRVQVVDLENNPLPYVHVDAGELGEGDTDVNGHIVFSTAFGQDVEISAQESGRHFVHNNLQVNTLGEESRVIVGELN